MERRENRFSSAHGKGGGEEYKCRRGEKRENSDGKQSSAQYGV